MSTLSDRLLDDEKFLADLGGTDSHRTVAARWGVSFSWIGNLRRGGNSHAKAASGVQTSAEIRATAVLTKPDVTPVDLIREITEYNADGSRTVDGFSAVRDRPVTAADVRAWLVSSGDNPDDWNIAMRSIAYGNGQFSNKMSAWPKPKKVRDEEIAALESGLVLDSIAELVRGFTFIPEPVAYDDATEVIVPTDLQVGKVDWNGGSRETTEQALESFHEFARICRERRPQEIVMVDAGDSIENIYSVSSQIATNDLDLPHQIESASTIFLGGIQILAPLSPSLRFAAVSSNHGAHRVGPKSPGGDAHADYGIVIAKMIGKALTLNPQAFGHVTVQTPEPYMESLYFQSSGSDIGVVHSHQAGGVDKIGQWWQGQSHGGLPVADARILICGHWHSLRVQQSGDGRWIFVGPASDRGSTWYTNLKGESSESGMLTFTTRNNTWSNLAIV